MNKGFDKEAIKKYLSGTGTKSMNIDQLQRFMIILLGVFHVYLFSVFLISHVEIMTIVNIFSILTYFIAYLLRTKVRPKLVFAVIYAEIIIHLIIGIIVLGDGTGLELYCLTMIPVNFYTSYALREYGDDKETDSFDPFPYCILMVVIWGLLKIYSSINSPIDYFNSEMVTLMFYVTNYVFVMVSLIIYMGGFLTQIVLMNKKLESQNEMLKTLSRTDALTGLENRRAIDPYADTVFEGEDKFSVVMSDIDDFKKINDTYGHDCGDSVLINIADIFQNEVEKYGKVCRWGGEEILIILPGRSAGQTKEIVENIREAILNSGITVGGNIICPTMTFGIADASEAKTIKEMIILADERLYSGKKSGKNCIIEK